MGRLQREPAQTPQQRQAEHEAEHEQEHEHMKGHTDPRRLNDAVWTMIGRISRVEDAVKRLGKKIELSPIVRSSTAGVEAGVTGKAEWNGGSVWGPSPAICVMWPRPRSPTPKASK